MATTIMSYRLQINGDEQTVTTTITFRNDTIMDTVEEDYTIVDANTLRLTDQETDESVDVEAMLTNSNDTLTLTFPSDDDDADPRSGTGVFEQ
jgi:hypothetical protein